MWRGFAAKYKLKAEVLSRKKILISDPNIQTMNDSQWLFELESIYMTEEKRYDDITDMFKLIKRALVSILGLNVMPISETVGEDDFGEPIIKLRQATEDEFLPLSMLCGSPEILSEVVKQIDALRKQTEVDETLDKEEPISIEAFEARVNEAMNANIPEFFDNPEEMKKYMYQNNPINKAILESMVKPLDTMNVELEKSSDNKIVKLQPKKKSKVVIE